MLELGASLNRVAADAPEWPVLTTASESAPWRTLARQLRPLLRVNGLVKLPPELWFTACLACTAAILAGVYRLPFSLPTLAVAEFIGVHYLIPLAGVAVCGACVVAGGGRAAAHTFCVALPCYAVVLVIHFNVKLWAPHINPVLYDSVYWQIDRHLYWLVDLCMTLRTAISGIVPLGGMFYLQGFILLFYVAFCYHAFRTPGKLRQLTMSVLLLQGLGGLAYLALPALGPFLYEQGLNAAVGDVQRDMLDFYRHSVALGSDWLVLHGSDGFVKGLAAMPSLHAGATWLFFIFAWKHAPRLVPFYLPLLAYIFIAAVSTRWHYLVDLPAGMLLAWLSLWLAERLVPDTSEARILAD